MRRAFLVVLVSCCFLSIGQAEDIRVMTWNVESDRPAGENSGHFADGNTPATIATELTALQQSHGPYDLIALTEVREDRADDYEAAVEVGGRDYLRFVSSTGGTDRLVIFIDEDRFSLIGSAEELESHDGINFPGGNARRPLFVRLRDSENNDFEFIFMTAHLTRGNENNRRQQALGLREWAFDQPWPVVAAGDFNFDFDFENLTGNQAMSIFLQGKVWKWIIPNSVSEAVGFGAGERSMLVVNFADSNWADNNDETAAGDRIDRYPGSILDFIFAAGDAKNWRASSRVVIRPGDFPDTADTSDHRPVEATLSP